ncbi:MAG: phospholipid/cholesterol/gamma-HCH transport system substrate-binding protein [Actinomycetota bacterium]|jgi:phospholipid/cholesterol/gamma-HCH transport system substrate-binding protein|nr:phospholipid/cholesterol/gamma-HCH transport system substrate-binding protein [Actinomycetota bacterium]
MTGLAILDRQSDAPAAGGGTGGRRRRPSVSSKPLVAGVVVLGLLLGLAVLLWPGGGSRHATAHFPRAVGLFVGSDVRILGVRVGTVDKIVPQGTSVRVDFTYDKKYKVPADAKAAVVAPSVVSDRYVQLTPVYRSGPVMRDGADIPLQRTATPVELDRIFSSLNDLNVGLGPQGANKDGALTRLLRVGADNLDGQGQKINTTLTDFSQAIATLGDGRDDLFGTVRNLQVFTSALAANDQQVRSFNQDLARVADQLAGERGDLAAALRNLAVALGEVSSFVRDNRANLTANIKGLAAVTRVLVTQRDALVETLEAGPVALSNLQLAYNPKSGTLDTRNNAQQPDMGALLCGVLVKVGKSGECADLIGGLQRLQAAGPPKVPAAVRAPDKTLGGILGGTP